jgi:Mrp family chromosome partitioning ATPase
MAQGLLTKRPPVHANGAALRHHKLTGHYSALVHRIQAANRISAANETLGTIGVASCAPGAGASTVAFNLAATAARADSGPVLFVDADVTKQVSRRLVPDPPAFGLADALVGAADPVDCIASAPIENLSIVAGRGNVKHELTFDPFKTAELLHEYKCHFKLVIVDIPAPTELNGSVYLAGQLAGVVLVVESGSSNARDAMRTKQQLIEANANVLGVVLNKHRQYVPAWLEKLL